jgi:26S proteasome non-ATPase regulatory subunit 9
MDGWMDESHNRADIDIYAVRTQRHRVNCLQTDHKQVMKEIEDLLPQVLAEARMQALAETTDAPATSPTGTSSGPTPQQRPGDDVDDTVMLPFVEIDQVFPGSPAEEAGLQVGDRVLAFGPVRGVATLPLPELTDLVPIVQGNENATVTVQVQRHGGGDAADAVERVILELTPKRWSGAGLLGCHLIKFR